MLGYCNNVLTFGVYKDKQTLKAMTEFAHTITTLRKIDPSKKFFEFSYCEESKYESAKWYSKGEILKIGENFYQISIKEHFSPLQEIPNLLVKHGRHTVEKFTV